MLGIPTQTNGNTRKGYNMTILLELDSIPIQGPFEIDLKHSFEIKIAAADAQQKVAEWLANEVSHMLIAAEPTLCVGEQPTWQVPVRLAVPQIGQMIEVGLIQIDTKTGQPINLAQAKGVLLESASSLVQRIKAYAQQLEATTGMRDTSFSLVG